MSDNQTPKQPSFQISCPCMTCSGYCGCGITGHHSQTPESGDLRNKLVEMSTLVEETGDVVYREFDIDQLEAFITAAAQASNNALLSRIYNLANDYANQDKTMIGSESIRGYHYLNALETVKLELERQQLGKENE